MYAKLSDTNEEFVLSLLTVGDSVSIIMGLVKKQMNDAYEVEPVLDECLVRIMGNLSSSENDAIVQSLVFNGAIKCLGHYVAVGSSKRKVEALWALSNISNHDQQCANRIVD